VCVCVCIELAERRDLYDNCKGGGKGRTSRRQLYTRRPPFFFSLFLSSLVASFSAHVYNVTGARVRTKRIDDGGHGRRDPFLITCVRVCLYVYTGD